MSGSHCNLGVQSQIEEFLEIKKAHQNGNSGVEGSQVSLTSVGKLWNKVVRIQNGRKKRWNRSVSYSCQFNIMHFICSLNYLSLLFTII